MPGTPFYSEEEEMRKKTSLLWEVMGLLVIAAMLMTSCAPATTQAPPATQPPAATAAPTEVASTEAPATAAATEAPATEAAGGAMDPAQFSPDIKVPDEEVTLTFASWVHTGEPDDAWEAMAKEFHDLYPNITIEFQDVPAEEMHDKLL